MLDQYNHKKESGYEGETPEPPAFCKNVKRQQTKRGAVVSQHNAASNKKYKVHVMFPLFFIFYSREDKKPEQDNEVKFFGCHSVLLFSGSNNNLQKGSRLYEKEITHG